MGFPSFRAGAAVVTFLTASAGVMVAADGPLELDGARVSVTRSSPPKPDRSPSGERSIRLDIQVVQIPVTVTDRLDRPVAGLRKESFQLFEDNVEQKIAYLSMEEAPASVGLIFDASGSMRNKIQTSVAAVDQFFQTDLPGDEFLVVRFSTLPHLLTGFTADTQSISRALHATQAQGWTALYDAIYLGIQKMKASKNPRRALLILSDGGDNNSRYTGGEIRNLVREADVRVYCLGLLQGSRFLERISDESGGRMIEVRRMADLPDAMEKLSRDLRSHYVLGYYSTNLQNDGRYRHVRVQVNQTAVHASWRRGYYAPLE
jgi:Ca-activated chloride channel homolog